MGRQRRRWTAASSYVADGKAHWAPVGTCYVVRQRQDKMLVTVGAEYRLPERQWRNVNKENEVRVYCDVARTTRSRLACAGKIHGQHVSGEI